MNIHDAMLEGYEPEMYCDECGEFCGTVPESFNYAGTHCTGGESGTHYTGRRVSDCCGALMTEGKPVEVDCYGA